MSSTLVILNKLLMTLQNNPHNRQSQVATLINQSQAMTKELLALCDHFVDENKTTLSMSKDFPRLKALGNSSLIIPLQESLTASLPPASSDESTHQPFPLDVPTFKGQFPFSRNLAQAADDLVQVLQMKSRSCARWLNLARLPYKVVMDKSTCFWASPRMTCARTRV